MPTLTLPALPALAALPAFGHTFQSVALAIIGIGFLIFVHELGHFLACRLTKTRVETFSMGFGPRLFGWESRGGVRRFTLGARRSPASGGTLDVRISAIPLGGYVKMAGEVGGDGTPGEAGAPARKPLPDEFPAKPFSARAFIISAGVLMNILAAVVLFTIAYAAGVDEIAPLVGAVEPGEAAWVAGIKPGDRIEEFGGTRIRSFDQFRQEVIFTSSSSQPEIQVLRGGRRLTLPLKPRYDEESGIQQAGISPVASWTVDDGSSPPVTVGPVEPVTVDGRPAVGGRAAAVAAREALGLGKREFTLAFPARTGQAPRTVKFPVALSDAPLRKEWKLGVAPIASLAASEVQPSSAAEAAGLRPGDRLLAADGVAIDRVARLSFLPSLSRLDVLRDGRVVTLAPALSTPEAVAAFVEGIALGGREIEKTKAVVVTEGSLFPDGKSPAEAAGIRTGDEIVEVAGKPVASWKDLVEQGSALSADEVSVKVRGEDGVVRTVRVTPKAPADLSRLDTFLTAVLPRETVPVSGPLDALGVAVGRVWTEGRNIFRMIGRFLGGEISPAKNLGGPGTIVNISSRYAQEGLAAFLAFLAFISVNLAVLNILPIPVLDGGSLFLLVVERLRGGRPLKEATVAYLQWAGLALLMLLMVFAIRNDIGNLSH